MAHRYWLPLAALLVATSSCGGSRTPLAPSPDASGGTGSANGSSSTTGTTVSAIDGQPLSGVLVKIGTQSTTSDGSGDFHLDNLGSGQLPAIMTGSLVVERHTTVNPAAQPLRETLIPSDFDLTAFDEMFRGTGQLLRWTNAPALVVLTTVMNYETGFGDQTEFHANAEQLTDAETSLLIDQLTEALGTLTAGTFTSFSSVTRESAANGAKVNSLRAGTIVVGRYKGLQTTDNAIGFGRWATDGTARVTGGAVFLDRDFDKSSDMRRLLRTHELGHALGYLHVTTRTSIMNPAIGPDVTAFDRQGAAIAFQRNPGNQSPDTDPGSQGSTKSGNIFSALPTAAPTIWAPPIN